MVVAKSEFYPEFFKPGISTAFFHFLDSTPIGDWTKLTTVLKSNKDKESYALFGNIPGMREFLDERSIQGFGKKWTYEIVNKKYEMTLGVRRDELEDEQFGVIQMRLKDMASQSRYFYDQKVFEMLSNGGSAACWDGANFFSTTHNIDGATNQSNAIDTAFSKTSLQAAINAMRRYKDDKGHLLGISPDTMLVSPELYWTVLETLNTTSYVATKQESAGSPAVLSPNYNVFNGIGLNVISTPCITSTTAWYLMDTKKAMRPIIMQDRTPLEFTAMDSDNDEDAFMRDIYKWGLRVRFGLGYGNWMTCLRGNT